MGWGNDSCKKPLFDTKGTVYENDIKSLKTTYLIDFIDI